MQVVDYINQIVLEAVAFFFIYPGNVIEMSF